MAVRGEANHIMIWLYFLIDAICDKLATFDADLTPGYTLSQVAALQRLTLWPLKLVPVLNRGQPERVLVGKVVTGSPSTVALNEGSGTEVFETGARRG
jgi:hypothetical protein